MTAIGHALIGAAIASKIPDPRISLPIILLSHFLGDKLPHWDIMTNGKEKSKRRILAETVADVLISYLLVLIIFIVSKGQDPVYMLTAAFTAQLPDWLEAPYLFWQWRPGIFKISYRMQSWTHDFLFNSRLEAPWGIVTQVIVVLLFLLWSAS